VTWRWEDVTEPAGTQQRSNRPRKRAAADVELVRLWPLWRAFALGVGPAANASNHNKCATLCHLIVHFAVRQNVMQAKRTFTNGTGANKQNKKLAALTAHSLPPLYLL
jgi:hypothetical protein